MAGFAIGVASETSAFKKGIQSGVIAPLEDAKEALDDLGKSKGLDKLEDGFRDAQKASEKLEREVKDTSDTIEREFRKSYAEMKNSSQSGTSAAKRDFAELGNEARQNASETFSSFDGSVQSFADGVQGTFGGIVSSLGPIGAAAGAAGALGIGLIIAAFDQAGEDAQEVREQIAALGTELIETGGIGETSIDFVIEKLKEMAVTTEEGESILTRLQRIADRSGSSLEDLARAYSLSEREVRNLWRAGQDRLDQMQAEYDGEIKISGTQSEATRGLRDKLSAQRDYISEVGKQISVAEEAAAAESRWLEAGGPALNARRDLLAAVNDAYDASASAVSDFVNAETGLFDVQAYIDAMAARSQALADYQTNLASSGLSPEALSFLNEQGVEAASQMLAGYQSAAPDQKAALSRIWSEAGRDNSGEYKAALETGMPKTVTGPVVTMQKPDVGWLGSAIQRDLNRQDIRITVTPVDPQGRRIP